jgi:hypothetical protein
MDKKKLNNYLSMVIKEYLSEKDNYIFMVKREIRHGLNFNKQQINMQLK